LELIFVVVVALVEDVVPEAYRNRLVIPRTLRLKGGLALIIVIKRGKPTPVFVGLLLLLLIAPVTGSAVIHWIASPDVYRLLLLLPPVIIHI
jgi:hypothetical protein